MVNFLPEPERYLWFQEIANLEFSCYMGVIFSEATEVLKKNRNLKIHFYKRLANMLLYFWKNLPVFFFSKFPSFFQTILYVLEKYDVLYTKLFWIFFVDGFTVNHHEKLKK